MTNEIGNGGDMAAVMFKRSRIGEQTSEFYRENGYLMVEDAVTPAQLDKLREITYRLTNINRGEPLKELFEVPPDYKVVEGGPGAMRIELKSLHAMP